MAFQELSKALQQESKTEILMGIFSEILSEIKHKKFDTEEDLLDLKRKFFTQAREKIITNFSEKWFVSKEELNKSAIQYRLGVDRIPNTRGIIESKDYEHYKVKHSGTNPFKYAQEMKKDWQRELDEKIVWLNDELR